MKTNKRTVWFLTLLSLVAVISIYYVKERAPMPFDGMAIFTKETTDATKLTEETVADETKPVFAELVLFEEMRMEVRNERSKLHEQLETKMTSSDFTAEQKNSAYEEMAALSKLSTTEALLEMEIKALGYTDAFVRSEDGKVKVTVLSTEGHSKQMADQIIHHVKTSWDDAGEVQVDFTGGTQ